METEIFVNIYSKILNAFGLCNNFVPDFYWFRFAEFFVAAEYYEFREWI